MLFIKQLLLLGAKALLWGGKVLLWGVIILAFSPIGFFLMPFIAAFIIIVAVFFEFKGWQRPLKKGDERS